MHKNVICIIDEKKTVFLINMFCENDISGRYYCFQDLKSVKLNLYYNTELFSKFFIKFVNNFLQAPDLTCN